MIQQGISIAESSIAGTERAKTYPQLSSFSQRFIASLRLTLGSLTYGAFGTKEMTYGEINLFFIVRITCLLISNMIFQKFIIGEIMKTFNTVRNMIDIQIERQRLNLIKESHDVLGRRTSNKEWFPKYLVIREQET